MSEQDVTYRYAPDVEAEARKQRAKWEAVMKPGTDVCDSAGNVIGVTGEAVRTETGWECSMIRTSTPPQPERDAAGGAS